MLLIFSVYNRVRTKRKLKLWLDRQIKDKNGYIILCSVLQFIESSFLIVCQLLLSISIYLFALVTFLL
ncbi:uncharacterized protein DS421_18g606950 [Arachis hypogaea]|nr:uncharacterized protein DS421_18g606950 [Arachis hypogaea]